MGRKGCLLNYGRLVRLAAAPKRRKYVTCNHAVWPCQLPHVDVCSKKIISAIVYSRSVGSHHRYGIQQYLRQALSLRSHLPFHLQKCDFFKGCPPYFSLSCT